MSASDYVRALYEYNAWANGHVIDAAARLPEAELTRDLGASFGSIHDNLRHVAGAQTLWLSRWAGAAPLDLPAPQDGRLIETLREAFDLSHAAIDAFVSSLTDERLAGTCSYTDTRGQPQERYLWQAMLQVVNHGTHHRAEAAMLLTSLGSAPRQLDYIFFEIERAGGPPRLI